ncbi:extensin family protein [Leptolyngbya sp. 15MV]|nr:extensin family protein [Leptolyngbya sp. 15MV]
MRSDPVIRPVQLESHTSALPSIRPWPSSSSPTSNGPPKTASLRSEHATANAIDIAGFVLRDGRDLTLLRDWPRETEEAGFLRAARDGACRWFRAVLGPEYNAAHRDHFHLDMGRWRACR